MRRILYISTAAKGLAPRDIGTILRQSHRNNTRNGITGLLFFDGVRFLQALEGDAAALDKTLERIRSDPRHLGIVILNDKNIDKRQFDDMAMASYVWNGTENARSAQKIDRLVAKVEDQDLKYQFRSFADIRG